MSKDRKNLLLDYMNPDYRQEYGWDHIFNAQDQIKILRHLLVVSVLMAKDYCVVPPGFALLSGVSFNTFMLVREFIQERLIRFPLKERSLDELVNKKRKQYDVVKGNYAFIYSNDFDRLTKEMSVALLDRRSDVGKTISHLWADGPDTISVWDTIKIKYTTDQIDYLRNIPKVLIDKNIACTLPAIQMEIGPTDIFSELDLYTLIHNSHGMVYFNEYDLSVLKNIPYFRYDVIRDGFSYVHDYEAFSLCLKQLGIWDYIKTASIGEIIRIRRTSGFKRFLLLFENSDLNRKKHSQLEAIVADLCFKLSDLIKSTKKELEPKSRIITWFSNDDSESKIDKIDNTLYKFSVAFLEEAEHGFVKIGPDATASIEKEVTHAYPYFMSRNGNSSEEKTMRHLAYFAALKLEVDVLKDRWGLTTDNNGVSFSKTTDVQKISVYSPFDMGRVSAAISTMKFLHWCQERGCLPDLITVTGIAGGFKEQKVEKGDVLVGTDIIDLSSRKIMGEEKPETQFRPKSWRLNDSILHHLNYTDFEAMEWGMKAFKQEDWDPENSRLPKIITGPIASMDEVVGNEEWVGAIMKNHPKMLGIEMEAGGVCPAAESFGIPFCVIRGVSDHADPNKTDDIWRRRAMRTIANLLETISN